MGVLHVKVNGVWTEIGTVGSVGPQGPQGIPGPTGPTGPQGATGPIGPGSTSGRVLVNALVSVDQNSLVNATQVDANGYTGSFTGVAGHVYVCHYLMCCNVSSATTSFIVNGYLNGTDVGVLWRGNLIISSAFMVGGVFAFPVTGAATFKLRVTPTGGVLSIANAGFVNGRFLILDGS